MGLAALRFLVSECWENLIVVPAGSAPYGTVVLLSHLFVMRLCNILFSVAWSYFVRPHSYRLSIGGRPAWRMSCANSAFFFCAADSGQCRFFWAGAPTSVLLPLLALRTALVVLLPPWPGEVVPATLVLPASRRPSVCWSDAVEPCPRFFIAAVAAVFFFRARPKSRSGDWSYDSPSFSSRARKARTLRV